MECKSEIGTLAAAVRARQTTTDMEPKQTEICPSQNRFACRVAALAHVESAVYVQNVAGDVACHGRGEKQRRIHNFLHVTESA